jgi:AcrR family transcriptional regulator
MITMSIPDKIRGRLYPTVLELFSERDFHRVNLREISRRSGVSTGTIYKYFSSKEELLFTILDEKIGEISRLIREHIAGIESTQEVFRKAFYVVMDYYDRNPGVAITAFITVPMRTWMEEESYRREEEISLLHEVMEKARLRGDFDTSVKNRQVSDLFYMFCYRHIHSWYYHGMKWSLADKISDFFDLFWRIVQRQR